MAAGRGALSCPLGMVVHDDSPSAAAIADKPDELEARTQTDCCRLRQLSDLELDHFLAIAAYSG